MTAVRPSVLMLVVGACALGFVGGWWSRASGAPNAPRSPPAGPMPISFASLERSAIADDVRAIVREELRSLDCGKLPHSPNARADADRAPPPPPTAEQSAAHDRAVKLVDDARAARRWTDDDAERLRELLPRLAEADREDVLHALLPAFNRGEVKVETSGPPL